MKPLFLFHFYLKSKWISGYQSRLTLARHVGGKKKPPKNIKMILMILLMPEILHQLRDSLHDDLQGFIHPRQDFWTINRYEFGFLDEVEVSFSHPIKCRQMTYEHSIALEVQSANFRGWFMYHQRNQHFFNGGWLPVITQHKCFVSIQNLILQFAADFLQHFSSHFFAEWADLALEDLPSDLHGNFDIKSYFGWKILKNTNIIFHKNHQTLYQRWG